MKKFIITIFGVLLLVVACQEKEAIEIKTIPSALEQAIQPDVTLQSINGTYIIYRSANEVEMTYVQEGLDKKLLLTEKSTDAKDTQMYIYKIPKSKMEDTTLAVYINGVLVPFDVAVIIGDE